MTESRIPLMSVVGDVSDISTNVAEFGVFNFFMFKGQSLFFQIFYPYFKGVCVSNRGLQRTPLHGTINPLLASGDFYRLPLTFANIFGLKSKTDRTSVLVWKNFLTQRLPNCVP